VIARSGAALIPKAKSKPEEMKSQGCSASFYILVMDTEVAFKTSLSRKHTLGSLPILSDHLAVDTLILSQPTLQ